ncbi:MAG: hypothetical protein Q4D38_08835 [Planctomycetia bacterium]|nr:hypothetical protein [Planctomycetia bacterium]
MHLYEENPFCTKRIRPGAIPFQFPEGVSAETLIDTLEQNEWCGQIIGPHGSGKSTLLATLLPEIERRGKKIIHIELQDGVRQLPLSEEDINAMDENTLLAIDGYEQLSLWTRWRLKSRSRSQKFGVIIIAHEPFEYPELYRTQSEILMGKFIVSKLLKNTIVRISDSIIEGHYDEHEGNLREMLFSLYDVYENAYGALLPQKEEKDSHE